MKNVIILTAVLFAFSLSLYSQTIEPEALYFLLPQSDSIRKKQLSFADPEYKQNKFMLFWQWGNHPRLTKALKMNGTHGTNPSWGEDNVIYNNTGTEIDFIWNQASWVEPNIYVIPHCQSNSFSYKPTFTVDPANFSPISSDTEHNIWGFRNRNITNPVIVNNRLQLTPLTSYTNPVLSNPWRCNNFYQNINDSTAIQDSLRNGKYWSVTLNLRRKDFSPPNNTKDNAPVLVIKMPYYLTSYSTASNGKIKFNTKPNPAIRTEMKYTYSVDTTHYIVSRGFCLGLDSALTDSIVITRNMLPNLADSIAGIGPDITITLSFIADGDLFANHNPFFKTGNVALDTNTIDSIGLDVYYRGNCGILLNYIRVGNPMSDKMWKGEYDSIYHYQIQSGINLIKAKNYKFIGFEARSEIADLYQAWDAQRYFNKLVGGTAIIEGNSNDPRFLYRSEIKHSWTGAPRSGETAVPYFRINCNIPEYKDTMGLIDSIFLKRIGFVAGFAMKYWPENVPADTMNSNYETEFHNNDPNRWHKLRVNDLSTVTDDSRSSNYSGMDYFFNSTNYALQGKSIQWLIESQTYPYYIDESMKNMLYNGENWYQNLFLFGEYTLEAKQKGTTGDWDDKFLFAPKVKPNSRPFTGEETRFVLWRSILFGSKGIAYDGHISPTRGFVKENKPIGDLIIVNGIVFDTTALGNNATDEDIIYKDDLWGGLDFIPAKDSATNLTHTPIYGLDSNDNINDTLGLYHSLNRDTTAKYLGCDTNRIYYGRKSPKTEMYKMHTWIRANDSLLMDLRLVGSISKGIRFWQGWDPRYASNPLTKYLKYDSLHIIYEFPNDTSKKTTLPSDYIKTRPIGRIDEITQEPFYEPWDSSLFDLAWHRPFKDSLLTGNVGYLIIQNRRVDPLFLYTAQGDPEKQYLKFLTTAEFDVLCDKGGKDPEFPGASLPPEHWRSYFNKKLGMREITIPFAIIDSTKDIYYRVEELTDGTEFADTLPWWKQEEIRNRINVTIPQGQTLVANYLPGLGRMYKVTIVYDTTSPITGELAFSNQTKMIAYPAGNSQSGQSSNYDFWKDSSGVLHFYKDSLMYYHIVYDRVYTQGKSRVYYRRSAVPYNREINTKIINWGPEILLSDTIVFLRNTHIYIPDPKIERVKAKAGVDISCKYPSIVVRYDEATDTVRVYVVFSCSLPHLTSHPDSSRIFMVESVFPHDTLFAPLFKAPNNLEPIAWGRVRSIDLTELDKYGGVSVNASFGGNYYAWCDTAYGIGVGFKTPDDRGFITNRKYIKYNSTGLCSQPSLNTYSRMEINEENCALVFKEHSEGQDRIIYSRLHNPGGSIDNYVPKIFGDTTSGYHREGYYSLDSSTVLINTLFGQYGHNAEYPVVYRPVSFALRPGYEEADSLHYVGAVWDRVYWQGTIGLLPTSPKSIYMKNIDIDDTQARWWLLPPYRFYSLTTNLAQPSPGPGSASSKKDGTFTDFGLADSAYLLNFIQYTGAINYSANIYQINHQAWINGLNLWIDGDQNNHQMNVNTLTSLGQGIFPHTTHTPVLTKQQDWYIHSRIFQTTGEYIKTSSKLFLKGQSDEQTIYSMLSLSDSTKNAQMSEIYMVDNQKSIGLKAFDSPEPGRIKAVDTIFSNWFRVDEMKELGFFSIIGDTTLYRMELEGQKGKIDIPVRKDYSKFLTSRKITLLNGKNNLYRIKLIKRNKDINVWVDLLFDSKRDLADMSNDTRDLNKSASQENSNHQIIDLGSGGLSADMDLRIFPNPANEFIYATGELLGSENQVIVYSLYNTTGLEVFKSEGISGQPIIIPTTDLTTGAYFLKAEQKNCDAYEIKHIISKSVIIQR